jgi:uncharacterized membrane-anchored protein YjiN (DUF445 family)
VTNKWLSPDVIAEKLNEVDLAKIILDFIQQPKHQQMESFDSNIVLKFANRLDNPKFADALQKNTKNRLPRYRPSFPFGTWLKSH